jgi:hypothetical protein
VRDATAWHFAPHFAYRWAMASWDDVRRIALGLPQVDERESRGLVQWRVGEKLFAWERPIRKSDLAALGDAAPAGSILGARVADESEKAAWLAEGRGSTSRPRTSTAIPPSSSGSTTSLSPTWSG